MVNFNETLADIKFQGPPPRPTGFGRAGFGEGVGGEANPSGVFIALPGKW